MEILAFQLIKKKKVCIQQRVVFTKLHAIIKLHENAIQKGC